MTPFPTNYVAVIGERDPMGWVRGVWVEHPNGSRVPLPMPTTDRGAPLSEGFEWGYGGQGPHALAVALIAMGLGIKSPEDAETLVRAQGGNIRTFKDAVVGGLDHNYGFRFERARLINMARLHRVVLSPAETHARDTEIYVRQDDVARFGTKGIEVSFRTRKSTGVVG